jgi:hypothetical protein
VKRTQSDGLQKWLESKKYSVSIDDASIELYPSSFETALEHWACDTSRLLSAGRETLSVIAKSKYAGKSIAWAIIQTYYAALYYAHAILRVNRKSVTYTTTSNLLNLRRICDTLELDLPFGLKTNQYVFSLRPQNKSIIMTQKNDGKGTHESLWHEFVASITSASLLSRFNLPDFESEILALEGKIIAAASCTSGETGYISSLRNQVQYTQLHGAWHPYTSTLQLQDCREKCGAVLSNTLEIESLNVNSDDNATRFLHSALLICWVAERFIRHVSRDKKCFLYRNRIPSF